VSVFVGHHNKELTYLLTYVQKMNVRKSYVSIISPTLYSIFVNTGQLTNQSDP